MRDDAARYAEKDIVVFGINGANAQSHQRFAQRHQLSVPLLVDSGLVVARLYDAAFVFGPIKIVRRTVVGIDHQGIVIFYRRGLPATGEILAAFD